MNSRLLTDLALALLAGYVGTNAMEPVGAKLYELESEQDRKREDAARPGVPYAIAARKAADLVGLTLTGMQPGHRPGHHVDIPRGVQRRTQRTHHRHLDDRRVRDRGRPTRRPVVPPLQQPLHPGQQRNQRLATVRVERHV
jgi:Xaa-Pro aminopeptidase